MEDMLTNIATYGYIGLFIYSLGGGFVGVMAAAVLASQGKLDLTLVLVVAFTANFIGDLLLFYMSRYHKGEMMNYMRSHRRKLALSHLLMKKHGTWVIYMQKFVYGIKTLIPLAIGLTKYAFTKFAFHNLLASLIWVVVVGFGSYLAGNFIMSVYEVVADKPYLAPVILLSLVGLIWFYMSWATKKR